LAVQAGLFGAPAVLSIHEIKNPLPLKEFTYASNKLNADLSKDMGLTDPSWRLVDVGTERLFDSDDEYGKSIWIGACFSMDASLSEQPLYLLLGRLRGSVTIYLNGDEIFSSIDPDLTYAFNPGLRLSVRVERNRILFDKPNTLVIRYFLEEGFTNIYPLFIGTQTHGVYENAVINFLNVRMYMLLAFFSLFLGVFFLVLFLTTGLDKMNLYYSLANFCLLLYFTHMGVEVPFLLQFPVLKFMKIMIYPGLLLIFFFVFHFLKKQLNRVMSVILIAANVLACIPVLFLASNVREMDSTFMIGVPLMVFELLYMSYMTFRELARKEVKVLVIFVGMNLGFLCGITDAGYLILGIYPNLWVQGYGFFAFNMALFLSISIGIIADQKKLALLNKEMEEKIRKRTKYLEQSNSALEKAIDAMKESNKSKTEFLAKVSHEMRTPLNCIIGFGNALKEHRTEAEKEKYLHFMLSESERLLTLINRVLELSRLQSGKVDVEMNSYRFKEQMINLAQIYEIKASSKSLGFVFDFDPELPDILVGDGLRIGQICSNLLDNAVKFTHKGRIAFAIRSEFQENDIVDVRVTVTDTGIGIAKDRQSVVFESFMQGDNSTTRKYGGTGLGITISKQLVEILGGSLEMESEQDIGTKFSFSLPLKKAKRIEDYAEVVEVKDGPIDFSCKAAVAEDYPPNRELMKMYLDTLGVSSVFAENGQELLDLLKHETVDIILLDIEMPIMDGQEAARRIRQDETLKKIPIIGITAHSADEKFFAFRKNGFDRILQKPVSLNQIRTLLVNYFGGAVSEPSWEKKVSRESPETTEQIAQMMNVTVDVLKELLEGFNRETSLFLKTVPALLEDANLEELHRGFHSLKGGALNFHLTELAQACGEVCDTIRKSELEKTSGAIEKVYELWMLVKHSRIFD
jgi:signal transduction histidine kinase/DNA-binding response OmpR family regulator